MVNSGLHLESSTILALSIERSASKFCWLIAEWYIYIYTHNYSHQEFTVNSIEQPSKNVRRCYKRRRGWKLTPGWVLGRASICIRLPPAVAFLSMFNFNSRYVLIFKNKSQTHNHTLSVAICCHYNCIVGKEWCRDVPGWQVDILNEKDLYKILGVSHQVLDVLSNRNSMKFLFTFETAQPRLGAFCHILSVS